MSNETLLTNVDAVRCRRYKSIFTKLLLSSREYFHKTDSRKIDKGENVYSVKSLYYKFNSCENEIGGENLKAVQC